MTCNRRCATCTANWRTSRNSTRTSARCSRRPWRTSSGHWRRRARPAPSRSQDVAPADALESAAVRLETGHPGLAGAIRAFVDALAKAGI